MINNSSVAESGSGAFLAPGSGIWDPEWVKLRVRISGMNNPDHISESLETIFWIKLLLKNSLCGSGMEKTRIRDKHPGSATLNNNSEIFCTYAACGGVRVRVRAPRVGLHRVGGPLLLGTQRILPAGQRIHQSGNSEILPLNHEGNGHRLINYIP